MQDGSVIKKFLLLSAFGTDATIPLRAQSWLLNSPKIMITTSTACNVRKDGDANWNMMTDTQCKYLFMLMQIYCICCRWTLSPASLDSVINNLIPYAASEGEHRTKLPVRKSLFINNQKWWKTFFCGSINVRQRQQLELTNFSQLCRVVLASREKESNDKRRKPNKEASFLFSETRTCRKLTEDSSRENVAISSTWQPIRNQFCVKFTARAINTPSDKSFIWKFAGERQQLWRHRFSFNVSLLQASPAADNSRFNARAGFMFVMSAFVRPREWQPCEPKLSIKRREKGGMPAWKAFHSWNVLFCEQRQIRTIKNVMPRR